MSDVRIGRKELLQEDERFTRYRLSVVRAEDELRKALVERFKELERLEEEEVCK